MTVNMPSDDVIKDAVALACRAPSLHNSQPWRWIKQGESLDLFGDPDRILPSTDSFGRQMIISCGVALNHVQAAFAAAGWTTSVQRIPNPNDPKHLARLSFRPSPNISNPNSNEPLPSLAGTPIDCRSRSRTSGRRSNWSCETSWPHTRPN